jgi:glycosyltransferase involved in cell wall biosynthesis
VPGVLYLVHGLPPEEYTGTPIVTRAYATGMVRRGWRAGVVYASPDAPAVPEGLPADEGFERFPVLAPQPNGLLWAVEGASHPFATDSREVLQFGQILERFRPDVLHVVDNVTMPLEWPELAHEAGVAVVRTVSAAEDLCGLIGPVSPRSDPVGYCEAPITPERCAICIEAVFDDRWGQPGPEDDAGTGDPGMLRAAADLSAGLLRARAERLRTTLRVKRARAARQFGEIFDVTVFATPGWRDYFVASLPLEPDRVRVVEMGLDLSPWSPERRRRRRPRGEPLVLAWATTLGAARGTDDVVAAFTGPALLERADYRLRIHGVGDTTLIEPLLEKNPNVEFTGRYHAAELPSLLGQADAGLSTSLFETFHRVPREYLLAGLPVVANPTFGIRDLIRHRHNGLLYEHTRPGSLAEAVITLLDDRELEETLADGARNTPVRSADEELDELAALYGALLR